MFTFLCDLFFLHVGGKLGFYYKDHEILPPLPGIDVLPLQCFPVFYSKKNSETIIIAAFPLLYSNSKTQKLTVYFHAVGFHRYTVENLNDVSSDALLEREVEEFDPPSEVCEEEYCISLYDILSSRLLCLC